MRINLLKMFTRQRTLVGAVLIGMVLIAAACSSPLAPAPASPTLAALAQPENGSPTAPPTATGFAGAEPTISPLPAVGTPGAPVTATLAVTRTATAAAPPAKPAATPVPPVKPGTLSGKIAYDVYGGEDYNYRTIHTALVTSKAGGQIIARAAWPAYSPDGGRIAYFHWTDGLYIANADGGAPIGPLYISPGVCCINWSRDGNWIVFADSPRASQPGGPIKMLKVDGAYKTVVDLKVNGNGPSFSPDGKRIVFSGCQPNTSTCGVSIAPTDSSGVVTVLTHDNGGNAHWSPDGKKIVYQGGDEAGHKQVFVINADGSGSKQLTNGKSNDGQPAWSRDGGSIFWRSDQNGTAWAIYVMNADGSNPRLLIPDTPADPNLWGWETISVAP